MTSAAARHLKPLQVQAWDGQKIKRPGVYKDIPLDDYHGDICVERSISSSGLRKIYSPVPWVKASPAHYWCQSIYNTQREVDEEESSALILGRAAHHLLFGQADFGKLFIQRPATINGETCNRVTRQGKLWHQRQEENGLTVLTSDQIKAIKGIQRELVKEPLIYDPEKKRRGILDGDIEHSWFWQHRSGVWLKVRPDATPNDGLDFVDLKTTKSVMWPDLQRTIRDYGYYMQAGLTAMAVQAIMGQPLNSFSFVFAETKEPHCIEIVTLKENEIARGIQACEIAIARFVRCMTTGYWPGPRGDRADARYIELNEFDQKHMDENLAADRRETQ